MADTGGMLGSYKIKALLITAALMLVPVGGAFVLVLLGKASAAEFIDLAKWAAGALGLTGTGTVVGRALEGMSEKAGVRTVTAGGDVTVKSDIPPPFGGAP